MDGNNSLQQQIASMKQSLFDEQILNDEFSLVEDFFTPYFVETVITVYFEDSPKYIDIIEQALEETPLDLAKLDKFLNRLKRCTRFGAQKLSIEVDKVLECCRGNDKEGSKAAFQRMKEEYNTLKNKLDAYIELMHRAQIAELSKRPRAGMSSTEFDDNSPTSRQTAHF